MTSCPQKKHLYECLKTEVMMSKKTFSWFRVIHKALKCPERRYQFWWRIASYMYTSKNKFIRSQAKRINRKLIRKYGCEIQLGAQIGKGLMISHHNGIVINGCAIIGSSLKIRQNTTIGIGGGTKSSSGSPRISIGNNVTIGAGSCIISENITIGNNVEIGAMSFINKDLPSDCVVYSEKKMIVIEK